MAMPLATIKLPDQMMAAAVAKSEPVRTVFLVEGNLVDWLISLLVHWFIGSSVLLQTIMRPA